MNKVILALAVSVAVIGLTACGGYADSPERKAFEQFVAKCKANPTTEDCKAWEESKNSPGG